MSSMTLSMLLMLKDMASGPLGQFTNKLQSVSNNLIAMGQASKSVGMKMVDMMQTPIKAFMEAEDASTRLKVSMMDSHGQVSKFYGEISKLATQLGNQLPGDTKDFQNMMTTLLQNGVEAQTILSGTGKAAAYLAVQLKMPYDAAAEFAANMANASGVAGNQMMDLLDTIQRTSNLGVKAYDMGEAFSHAGGALKGVHYQGLAAAQSMGILFAELKRSGLSGETIGTNFAAMVGEMKAYQQGVGSAGQRANQELKAMGLQLTFLDKKGTFLGPQNMIAQFQKIKTQLSPTNQTRALNALFGEGQDLQMAQTLMTGGTKAYYDLLKKSAEQAKLKTKVDAQLNTTSSKLEAAQGTFMNTMAQVGASIAPELNKLIDTFGTLSEKLGNFAATHPMLTKLAAGFTMFGGAALVAGGTAMTGIGMLAKLKGPAGDAITFISKQGYHLASNSLKATQAMSAWNASTKSWAATQAQAAGSALKSLPNTLKQIASSTGSSLTKLPGQMATFFKALPTNAGNALASMPGQLRSLAAAAKGGIGQALTSVATGIRAVGLAVLTNPIAWAVVGIAVAAVMVIKYWKPITGFFRGLWAGLKAGLGPIGPAFAKAFSGLAPLFNPIMSGLKNLWNWLKNLLHPVDDVGGRAENMGRRFGTAIGQMIAKGAELLSAFLKLPGQFVAIGANIIGSLMSGLESKWSGLMSWVSNAANTLANAFKGALGIHSPSRVFMYMGNMLGEGLHLGMKAQLQQISQTAHQMARASIPNFPSLMTPAFAGSSNAAPYLPPARLGGNSEGMSTGGNHFSLEIRELHVHGGGSPDAAQQGIQEAFKLTQPEFERMLKRVEYDRRRRNPK